MRRLLLALAVLLALAGAAWLVLGTRDAASVAAPSDSMDDAPDQDPVALARPADEVAREAIGADEPALVDEPPAEEERYILDVYMRERPDVRIPRVTVRLEPSVGAGLVSPVRITKERRSVTGGGAFLVEEALNGESVWTLQDVAVPVVLPLEDTWQPVRVMAMGYQDALVAHVPGPGTHRVELGPARSLLVSLTNPPVPGVKHVVHLSGRGIPDSFSGIVPPERCFFLYPEADAVTVRVSVAAPLGLGPFVFEQEVVLEPTGRTDFLVDLSRTGPAAAGGLELTLAADGPIEDMGRWRVELRPLEESNEALLTQTPSSAVGAWRTLAPQQEYTERFDGIRPGDYEVVVTPIGLRQAVRIDADGVASATIRVPALSVLTVVPVDGAGVPLGDGVKLGHLFWKLDDGSSETSDELSGNDFAMGRSRAAKIVDDRWVIEAPFGRRVLVHLLGPKALGAEPLRVMLDMPAITIDLPLRGF